MGTNNWSGKGVMWSGRAGNIFTSFTVEEMGHLGSQNWRGGTKNWRG